MCDANVILSDEARCLLLAQCRDYPSRIPVAVITWREPTADLRRAANGDTLITRVAGSGSVMVIPSDGKIAAKSIFLVQDVPIFLDAVPDSAMALCIGVVSGKLTVERRNAGRAG